MRPRNSGHSWNGTVCEHAGSLHQEWTGVCRCLLTHQSSDLPGDNFINFFFICFFRVDLTVCWDDYALFLPYVFLYILELEAVQTSTVMPYMSYYVLLGLKHHPYLCSGNCS
jgi:hypothetical protein